MSVSTDAVIRVSGREAGSQASHELSLDPLPVGGNAGQVSLDAGREGCIVEIADLREALDRVEHIQKEDGR